MSIVATEQSAGTKGASHSWGLSLFTSRWTAFAMLTLAIVQQSLGHHNADNSWLFTVAEKVLAGERPYVDVLETNPPASFILYMPAAIIARVLHLSTEFVVSAAMFAMAAACALFAARILRAAGLLPRDEEGFLLLAATFALLNLPSFNFAEREHVALVWVLPMLAIHAARMAGTSPSKRALIFAGLLAGLAVCIKPHFALAIGLSFLGVMHARRSLGAMLSIENLIAAAVVLVYGGVVVVFFPDFFKALPAIVDAYVPLRQPWLVLLQEPWLLLNMVLLAAAGLIGGRACFAPRAWPLLAASVGFTGAYFWQGKGWMNHELPSVALICLAMALLVAPMLAELRATGASPAWRAARPATLFAALPAALCAPLLFGAIIQWTMAEEHEGLTAIVRRHAPAHPTMMALSPQLTAGFPLVRRLDGEWVGRAQRLWLTVSARMLLDANRGDEAYRARLRAYVAEDTGDFLVDARARRPDVILVDKDPRVTQAIRDIPALAAALDGYVETETADDLAVWLRRD